MTLRLALLADIHGNVDALTAALKEIERAGPDRILVLGATEVGRRRALAGAAMDVDWSWPPRALRGL